MREQNLATALRMGLITWFQYFELLREVPEDKRIVERKAA